MPKKTNTERVKARERQGAQKPPKKSALLRLKECRARRIALKVGIKPLDIQKSTIDNMDDISNTSASLKTPKVSLQTCVGSTNPVFLIPMCFICLKTKSNLSKVSAEILIKLLFCIEETDEFTEHIFNGTKICTNCFDELNVSFLNKYTDPNFKKICVKNIIQFKNYVTQLTSVCNDNEEVMKIELTDFGIKQELNQDDFDDSINFDQTIEPFEHGTIKNEIFEEACEDVNEPTERLEECSKNSELQSLFSERDQILPSSNSTNAQLHVDVKLESLVHKEEIIEDICSEEANQEPVTNLKAYNNKEEAQLQYYNTKYRFILPKNNITPVNEQKQPKPLLSFSVNELFICPLCLITCNIKKYFYLHQMVLNELYSCQICKQSFQLQGAVPEHMSTHDIKQTHCSYLPKESFTCPKCGRDFRTKAELSKHSFVHTIKAVYKCPICGNDYHSKAGLSSHMITHSNEGSFKCPKCGICFRYEVNLKLHMEIIHLKLGWKNNF